MVLDLAYGNSRWRVICAYMPDSWSSSLDKTQMLYDNAEFLVQQVKNDQRYVLICSDFNASVGNIIPNEDPTSVGNFGIGPRTARGSLLTSFVQSEGLQICNRQFQHDLANTYTFFHPTTGMRQIDFIICGSLLEVVDSWTDSAISVGNDHKCVHAIIRPPTPVHGYAKRHKSNTCWKPHLNDDNDAAAYHARSPTRQFIHSKTLNQL